MFKSPLAMMLLDYMQAQSVRMAASGSFLGKGEFVLCPGINLCFPKRSSQTFASERAQESR